MQKLAKRLFFYQKLSYSTSPAAKTEFTFQNNKYSKDDYTNVTDNIASYLGRNLHLQANHPLNLVYKRIINYFYKTFTNSLGNPSFSVYDNLNVVVSVDQNFDSLLTPPEHPSRAKSDCYYLNRQYLLRAHMTAYQSELMRSGLNDFIMCGDVYRRDEIDKTHFPVFHQLDAVRLRTKQQLFGDSDLRLFEATKGLKSVGNEKQGCHSLEAVKLMEFELKSTLTGLAKHLFQSESLEYRWVDAYFPFTLPSYELEINHEGKWIEILGCGIMRNEILETSGVRDRIGWAFGLGLERLAMILYKIPDIRLFWSKDTGFLNQFKVDDDIDRKIAYKPVSQFPQCKNDLSFWIPDGFSSNDFYDLVRDIGGDLIEQVELVDQFKHPKTGKTSHCYRIIYRHMERTLKQEEVNRVHKKIELGCTQSLKCIVR